MVRSLAERLRAHRPRKPGSPNRKPSSRAPNAAGPAAPADRSRRIDRQASACSKSRTPTLLVRRIALAARWRRRQGSGSASGPFSAGAPSRARRACAMPARQQWVVLTFAAPLLGKDATR